MTLPKNQEIYKLLRKTQKELDKAYRKINELEFLLESKPLNDKDLLTRELTRMINKYEELYNERHEPIPSKNVLDQYSQTLFWKKDQFCNTETVQSSEIETATEYIKVSDAEASAIVGSAEKISQTEPKVQHKLIQTNAVVLGLDSPETIPSKEIKFDISRIPQNAIVEYNITLIESE